MDIKFLGKELGIGSGWDGDLGGCWWVYDFIPATGIELPECKCLQFNEDKGQIVAQDDEGNDLKTWNINWTYQEAETQG